MYNKVGKKEAATICMYICILLNRNELNFLVFTLFSYSQSTHRHQHHRHRHDCSVSQAVLVVMVLVQHV